MPSGGTHGSGLVINCNMAQAFEVPTRGWIATEPMCSDGSNRTTPDPSPKSPLPAGLTHQLDRCQEYGSTFGSPQARRYRPNAACDGPDSRIGAPQRLINPGGFDKADARSAGPAFQKFPRTMKADSPPAGRLTRFLAADLAPAAFNRGGDGAGRNIFIPGNKESPRGRGLRHLAANAIDVAARPDVGPFQDKKKPGGKRRAFEFRKRSRR
jgi:hypothetical protein